MSTKYAAIGLAFLLSSCSYFSDKNPRMPSSSLSDNRTAFIAGKEINVADLMATPACKDFTDFVSGKGDQKKWGKVNTYSLVVKDQYGNILMDERYNNAKDTQLFQMWSISKFVTTMAYSRLMIDSKNDSRPGTLTKKSKLIDYIASSEGRNLIRTKMTKSPTADDLMSMASGIPWCEYATCSAKDTLKMNYTNKRSDTVMAYLENLKTVADKSVTPGEVYNYSAGNAVLLQAIMKGYLGSDYESWWKNFFNDLGISRYAFEKDGQGVYAGGSGLFLSGRDLARFGDILISKGKIHTGEQYFDAKFIDYITEMNPYLLTDKTPEEVTRWEGGTGRSLWVNYRGMGNIPQFMPRVPGSMIYSAGLYGQRLMVFPEHKTAEQKKIEGHGLGLFVARVGAETNVGHGNFSSHWKPFSEKFYRCFSPDQKLVAKAKKPINAACRAPYIATADQKVEDAKNFLYELIPARLQALGTCNCIWVMEGAVKNRSGEWDKDETLRRCQAIMPAKTPPAIPDAFLPYDDEIDIDFKKKTVTSWSNPMKKTIRVGLWYKARAVFDEEIGTCRFDGKQSSFSSLGRFLANSTLKKSIKAGHEIDSRLNKLKKKRMSAKGLRYIDDGCYEGFVSEEEQKRITDEVNEQFDL
jgi:CubicO group peptidase (beta-lactamase class C family)